MTSVDRAITEEAQERKELLAAIQRRLPALPLWALRAVLGLLWGLEGES